MRNLIVVGSGIAGLFPALSAHRRGVRDVLIVTKATLEESATRYAQGGIAAAVGDGDSWEPHELYACTTNPSISTGDGVALALRAGAVVADLEFFQFHPTAFAGSGASRFLISEAVRGHGAVLRNHLGEAFMARYDERRELAPRDIVARSILQEMERHSLPNVWLDATHFPRGEFAHRFPTIHAHCVRQGCDPEREPIPVSPAAHYMMGGVWTDAWGRTSVPGLIACGETASTGVHGANRLASNSLLEGVVFGARVAQALTTPSAPNLRRQAVPDVEELTLGQRANAILSGRERMRALMWEEVGILRHQAGLHEARAALETWASALPDDGVESHETANLALVGWVMAEAALRREESRGAHYRIDFPEPRREWRRRQVFAVPTRPLLGTHAIGEARRAGMEVLS